MQILSHVKSRFVVAEFPFARATRQLLAFAFIGKCPEMGLHHFINVCDLAMLETIGRDNLPEQKQMMLAAIAFQRKGDGRLVVLAAPVT